MNMEDIRRLFAYEQRVMSFRGLLGDMQRQSIKEAEFRCSSGGLLRPIYLTVGDVEDFVRLVEGALENEKTMHGVRVE